MATDFNGILPGVRMRSLQCPSKSSVDFPGPINNSAILDMADSLTKGWRGAENPSSDLDSPGPAQSYDSKPSLPAGGRNSHNGFCQTQGRLLSEGKIGAGPYSKWNRIKSDVYDPLMRLIIYCCPMLNTLNIVQYRTSPDEILQKIKIIKAGIRYTKKACLGSFMVIFC